MVAMQQHPLESSAGSVTRLPQLTIIVLVFCCVLNAKTVSLSLPFGLYNLYQLVRPGLQCPTQAWQVLKGLNQFIQQSSYAVVLLRGAGYGFVAHGADAANLQPLHQTPEQKNTDGNKKEKPN